MRGKRLRRNKPQNAGAIDPFLRTPDFNRFAAYIQGLDRMFGPELKIGESALQVMVGSVGGGDEATKAQLVRSIHERGGELAVDFSLELPDMESIFTTAEVNMVRRLLTGREPSGLSVNLRNAACTALRQVVEIAPLISAPQPSAPDVLRPMSWFVQNETRGVE